MTKATSSLHDNGGRCEDCDDPETVYKPQTSFPVRLGGDLGWGTMWLCAACAERRRTRDEETSSGVLVP